MASAAKRRAIGMEKEPSEGTSDEEQDEESDSDNSEDTEEEEELDEQEVKVDFEAHSLSENDFNGIKKLLQQVFLKANINTSELTDILIQQNHIGSVIRQAEVPEDSDDEDADEVYGFISLLNLTERKGTQCVEQIKEALLSQCEKNCKENIYEQLNRILSDTSKPVGLLLSERFINVPPQIALPMHKQLQEEITEAQRTNKPSGKCHYYLLISRTFKEAKRVKESRSGGTQAKEQLMFANAEEEFFHEVAALAFNYSVQEESDSFLGGRWSFDDVPMKPFRTVILIPADKIPQIMDKLKEYLSI
ncbi:BCCIP protein, partial [Polypterus senegalus]